MRTRLSHWWPALALVALLIYPWVLHESYYHVLGFSTLLYAVMATSWNIMGGYTGYKSLGHAAFFGLGAYLVALAAVHLGWEPLLSAPVLAGVGLVVAFGLGRVRLGPRGA